MPNCDLYQTLSAEFKNKRKQSKLLMDEVKTVFASITDTITHNIENESKHDKLTCRRCDFLDSETKYLSALIKKDEMLLPHLYIILNQLKTNS